MTPLLQNRRPCQEARQRWPSLVAVHLHGIALWFRHVTRHTLSGNGGSPLSEGRAQEVNFLCTTATITPVSAPPSKGQTTFASTARPEGRRSKRTMSCWGGTGDQVWRPRRDFRGTRWECSLEYAMEYAFLSERAAASSGLFATF